jgi:hypothetical protein
VWRRNMPRRKRNRSGLTSTDLLLASVSTMCPRGARRWPDRKVSAFLQSAQSTTTRPYGGRHVWAAKRVQADDPFVAKAVLRKRARGYRFALVTFREW